MTTDPIDKKDIDAYIDGELDIEHRLTVEDYLSRHPDLAAQVMAYSRDRSALQLLGRQDFNLSRSLAETTKRIHKEGRGFRRRSFMGLVAMIMILGIAVGAMNITSPPPSYIGLAAESHRSIEDRVSLAAHKPISDRAQALLSASRIAIPKLPSDWQVFDVELVRMAEAPALLLAVQTGDGHTLSILAIRERSSAPRSPDTIRDGRQSVAYWRKGDFSYALTGEGDPGKIDATADALASSWRV